MSSYVSFCVSFCVSSFNCLIQESFLEKSFICFLTPLRKNLKLVKRALLGDHGWFSSGFLF